jgi:hypothetical protein
MTVHMPNLALDETKWITVQQKEIGCASPQITKNAWVRKSKIRNFPKLSSRIPERTHRCIKYKRSRLPARLLFSSHETSPII